MNICLCLKSPVHGAVPDYLAGHKQTSNLPFQQSYLQQHSIRDYISKFLTIKSTTVSSTRTRTSQKHLNCMIDKTMKILMQDTY